MRLLLSVVLSMLYVCSGAVISDPDLDAAYASFNSASASTKLQYAHTMLTKTQYGGPLVSQNQEPPVEYIPDLIGFAEKRQTIETESFINAVNIPKVVHRCGVAATVSYTLLSGTPPSGVFPSDSSVGVVRVSTGSSLAVLGFAMAVFGDGVGINNDGNIVTRVFSTDPLSGTTIFNVNLTQQLVGVTAQGPEGRLMFQPAPILYGISIATLSNPLKDFRREFEQIPQGVIGYIVPAPDYPANAPTFNISITITSPFISSQAADQNWHFRRTLKSFNLLGDTVLAGFAWVISVSSWGQDGGLFKGALQQWATDACNLIFNNACAGTATTNGVNVDTTTTTTAAAAATCPYANNPNLINQATIAAIVIASITTLGFIGTTIALIKQRKNNQQVTAIELKA